MSELMITLDASEEAFLHLFDKLPMLGRWSVVARLKSGLLKVMLSLDEDDLACAGSQAEEGGFLGAEDYINDELRTALMEIEGAMGESPPPSLPFAMNLSAQH